MDKSSTPPIEAYSVQQVAGMLGVSAKTIYRLVADNSMPHIRLGAAVRITRQQLEDFIGKEANNG